MVSIVLESWTKIVTRHVMGGPGRFVVYENFGPGRSNGVCTEIICAAMYAGVGGDERIGLERQEVFDT